MKDRAKGCGYQHNPCHKESESGFKYALPALLKPSREGELEIEMAYTRIADIGEIQLSNSSYSFQNGNPCNILTVDNIVMLCDNIVIPGSLSSNQTFATLSNPTKMAPLHDIILPLARINNGSYGTVRLKINTSGQLSISSSCNNATLYLNGLCFNVNDKYYTPTIGNIYNNGTSPLDAS